MEDDGFFSACPDPELSSILSKHPAAPKTYTEDLPAARVRFNTIFTEIFHSVQRAQLPPDHSVPVDGGVILVRTYRASAPDDAIQTAKRIRADPAEGLLVGGQSAGANLPAVIAHRGRSDPFFVDYPITGQVLQIPVLLHPDAVPQQYAEKLTSYTTNYDARILNEGHMRDYFEKLRTSPTDPELSVLLQPSFNGLPPAYIQVCGRDPLRDEALVYATMLEEFSVAIRIDNSSVTNESIGDLVYFHGLGNRILVINSLQTIQQLFDKKGAIYSDRPSFTVVGELMNLGQVRSDMFFFGPGGD
ncbi:AB hydrolase superfamily protein B1A11.02 [Trametes pubescens]|uniref:AB hydrolase superfamily protein B1A11.02 n=1 Tax=Trametes pubescens TaxID=154538 RepID=A0A1M2VTQ7_TRAPU|nr:AB hydrolase superfamily protein B1A11.02 [Trametes pubescens]